MYVPIIEILFLSALSIFLILIYRKILYNAGFFGSIKYRYSAFSRKAKINDYIKQVNKQPIDPQKLLFKEASVLIAVIFVMSLFATKAIFFTAVVSGSMSPTFDKDDLVLIQNVDRNYSIGDIVMFKRPDTSYPVTHRIRLIADGSIRTIRTAGDATGQMDWWEIKNEDILGKAVTIQGKPIVIKGYGKYFVVDDKHQDFGPFGQNYGNYFLFFQLLKIYGYIIAVASLLLYIVLTVKKKPWMRS